MFKIYLDKLNKNKPLVLLASLAFLLFACEDDDPETTSPMGGEVTGGEVTGGEVMGGEDMGGDDLACTPLPEDYPSPSWEMCISDEGRYELAGEGTPSSAARIAAFETIGDLLWRVASPDAEAFTQAEFIYGEDGGLGSRVTRRYDAHVNKPEGADCSLDNAAEQWPDYCVGPAKIEPLILNAFAAGIRGENPVANAARVKAGGLWFSYLSVYKEAYTCAGKAADCDSHWAYCNGAKQLDEMPLGLGAAIKGASESAYEALFNAHLAVRCWRDLDNAEVAENEELRAQALDQLDRALDRGYAVYLASLLEALSLDAANVALRVEISVLGPTLFRAANAADPSLVQRDWDEFWTEIGNLDVELSPLAIGIVAEAMRRVTPCPQ